MQLGAVRARTDVAPTWAAAPVDGEAALACLLGLGTQRTRARRRPTPPPTRALLAGLLVVLVVVVVAWVVALVASWVGLY